MKTLKWTAFVAVATLATAFGSQVMAQTYDYGYAPDSFQLPVFKKFPLSLTLRLFPLGQVWKVLSHSWLSRNANTVPIVRHSKSSCARTRRKSRLFMNLFQNRL